MARKNIKRPRLNSRRKRRARREQERAARAAQLREVAAAIIQAECSEKEEDFPIYDALYMS